MNRKLLFSFFFIAIAGCSSSQNRFNETLNENKNRLDGFKNEISKAEKQKSYNKDEFVIYTNEGCKSHDQPKHECPFYKEKEHLGDWPPKVGLALSGGGTRSASFSIGVLKALHKIGILEDVDVISAVSGGAYAAYWYFSQNFYMEKVSSLIPEDSYKVNRYDENDLFLTSLDVETNLEDPNKYRFQRTLEESSIIMAYTHKPSWLNEIKVDIQYGVETAIQVLTIPIHWIAGGLFDWELNMMPYFYFYKDGLDRAYGYVPLDYSLENFANARGNGLPGSKNIDAEPILLSEMRVFLEDKKKKSEMLPYFIINTTGRFGAEYSNNKERAMEDTVFEFTPWGCHSTLLGINNYEECPEDFRINSPVGLRDLDFSRIVAISGAAVDGQAEMVDIAGNGEKSSEFMKKTWLDIGLDITHLNMGYHVSNRHSPLYRRIFHKLLPWPLYLADDWQLGDEATSIYLSDGGHSDNLGVFSLIRRGVKMIYVVDGEQDGDSIFEGAKRLNNALNKYGLKLSFKQNKPLAVLNSNDSVIDAEIINVDPSRVTSIPTITIKYIKLSMPARHQQAITSVSEKLPFTVRSYMEENPKFPHQSTVDIFYSPEQFKAYRDLGYTVTMCGLSKCPEVN